MSSAEPAADVDAEGVERVRELDPAAADVGMVGTVDRHLGVGGDAGAGLGDRLAVDADLAGEDQRPRPLARRGEAALDEQHVEPEPVLQCVRATTQRAMAASWPPRPARVERVERALDARSREPPRFFEAVDRRIGGLAGRGILAGGLAEIRRRAFDVEDVVDDLKREADALAVGVDRRRSSASSGAGHDRAGDGRCPDQGAGLARVHRAQASLRSSGVAPGATRPRRSSTWPPTMPAAPGSFGDDADHAELFAGRAPPDAVGAAAGSRASSANASVSSASPGEDGHRFAMDDVRGRASAPHGVVVHRREVVVDQRVGVDQLDRARRRHREPAGILRREAERGRRTLLPRRGRASAAGVCRRRAGCSASRASGRAGRRRPVPKMPIRAPARHARAATRARHRATLRTALTAIPRRRDRGRATPAPAAPRRAR